MVHLCSVLPYILVPFSGMVLITCTGLFDQVELDLGLEHYAEPAWLPVSNVMPLNSLINLGYICLGLYWCGMTRTATKYGILKDKDSALFYTFNICSILYGFIQLLRVITQGVVWSILDQWCTFPFFALLLVWGFYYQYGWSNKQTMFIISISLISYTLSLFFQFGFEIALAFHIIGALCGAVMAYQKHPAQGSLTSFFMAIISCLGFVVLKLLDHKLAAFSSVFRYVSGHFLSKICDIAQIYFVNSFFLDLTLQKAADLSVVNKNKYFNHCESNGFNNNTNDVMYEVSRRSNHT